MTCRLKGDLAPFVHVCKSCVDFQINEANLLEKDSALLNSTLLFPCSLVCNKKCEIQIANHATALQLYIKGMCRDCDRTQRAMCLDEAARVSPNFREALFWSAILDFRDVKLNIKRLQHALSLTKYNSCKALVIQSQILVIQRNIEKALEILNSAFEIADNDGERGEVAYFRAFSNWWLDQDAEAINDFNIAISFHYNIKSCYTQLAEIYAHLRKPRDEIEALYQKSLLTTSRHTELLKYGVYLKRIQDFDRALLMLSTAKERNPLSPDSFEEMAIPNNSKREENYLTAVQLDTECRLVNSRRALAAMCADNNKFDEALNVLSEGLKKREKFEWYCLRGQMYFFSKVEGSYALGIKDLRKAVYLNPLSADSQYWLGKCLEKDLSATTEVIQRYSNVIYLHPNYPRLPESVREHISSLELSFKFYDDELEGLYNNFLYGSNHISTSQIHRYLNLLASSGNPKMLFLLFRDYYVLFENWIVRDKSSQPAIRSLRNIWTQKIYSYLSKQSVLKSIPSKGSSWADLYINSVNINLDRSIVLSDSFTVQCLEKMPKPMSELLIAYLYRKDITVSFDRVESFLNLLNHCESSHIHGPCKSKKTKLSLNQFLYQFATKKNMLKRASEEVPLEHSPSWEDSLDDDLIFPFHSDSFSPRATLENRGTFNYDSNFEKETKMTDFNVSKGENVLLPFSQIPKEVTKLVNNRLHSNVTFLLRKSLSIEESISISYDSKINLHLDQFERIYGHKEIIEVNSRYFESMFHSGLKESIRGEIIIEGIEYDVFLQVLYHLYGGQAKFTHDNCIPLLRIADKFCIDSLKLACELYIGNYAEIDDDLIDLVAMYNATRLSSLWKIRDIFVLDEDYNGEVNGDNGEITFF